MAKKKYTKAEKTALKKSASELAEFSGEDLSDIEVLVHIKYIEDKQAEVMEQWKTEQRKALEARKREAKAKQNNQNPQESHQN